MHYTGQKILYRNELLTMAGQFPEYGLMALGGMLCMITGGIDLSVVGTANMASILTVFTLTRLFGADGTMPLAFSVCDLPDRNCNRYCCWKSERLFDLKTWGFRRFLQRLV